MLCCPAVMSGSRSGGRFSLRGRDGRKCRIQTRFHWVLVTAKDGNRSAYGCPFDEPCRRDKAMRYFVYLEFDGAPITDGRSSRILPRQQCLEDSLFLFLRREVTGAALDAVYSIGMVAHFDLDEPQDCTWMKKTERHPAR